MTDFDVMVVPSPEPDKQGSHDLAPFREINKRKVTWDERVDLIKKQFPSTVKMDWYKIFSEDPSILGRLINDILKVDQAEPGKPGKRPAIDVHQAENRLRQIAGDDYTALPFQESFRVLAAHRSIRAVANKTGLDRNLVHRLLQGEADPSAEIMEKIAKAFNKEPGYFAEYRVAYLFGVMFHKLNQYPESTVGFYRKLRNL